MPLVRLQTEIEFLDRVDDAWRRGRTLEQIAKSEISPTSKAAALYNKVSRIGFLLVRKGGYRLVGSESGRDYRELRESGEIVAASESQAFSEQPVAAT